MHDSFNWQKTVQRQSFCTYDSVLNYPSNCITHTSECILSFDSFSFSCRPLPFLLILLFFRFPLFQSVAKLCKNVKAQKRIFSHYLSFCCWRGCLVLSPWFWPIRRSCYCRNWRYLKPQTELCATFSGSSMDTRYNLCISKGKPSDRVSNQSVTSVNIRVCYVQSLNWVCRKILASWIGDRKRRWKELVLIFLGAYLRLNVNFDYEK